MKSIQVLKVCDDIDNDCNGAIDDGLSTSTYYVDEDGDGYGTESSAFESCLPWFFEDRGVLYSGDCLDSNDAVHPGGDGLVQAQPTPTQSRSSDPQARRRSCSCLPMTTTAQVKRKRALELIPCLLHSRVLLSSAVRTRRVM